MNSDGDSVMLPYRPIALSPYRPIALSPYRPTALSPYRLSYTAPMSAALLTSAFLSFAGLMLTAWYGFTGADLSRHVLFGIFATMMTLLTHSMLMFYLIGKGKAVREAAAEGGLSGEFFRRIAVARRPVFSVATLAMSLTIVAALVGASVDTGVLPPPVHALLAYVAIAANIAMLRVELMALRTSAEVVAEVNQRLNA